MSAIPLTVPRADPTAIAAIARVEDRGAPLTASLAEWLGATFDPAMTRTRLGQRLIAEASRARHDR